MKKMYRIKPTPSRAAQPMKSTLGSIMLLNKTRFIAAQNLLSKESFKQFLAVPNESCDKALASETKNAYFTTEKSRDCRAWELWQTGNGSGNSGVIWSENSVIRETTRWESCGSGVDHDEQLLDAKASHLSSGTYLAKAGIQTAIF